MSKNGIHHTPDSDYFLGHPKGLYVLLMVEIWERFGYYGMRALLMLYMVQSLHYSAPQASHYYGLYSAFTYITPVLGGYVADQYIGQRLAILLGAILMCVGHFTMAVQSEFWFVVAMALLIVGNGFFKPNTSVLVGQLYGQIDAKRDAGYSIFYMGINVGAFLSPLICGTLGQKIGWQWGFMASGVGMMLGIVIYLLGQHHLNSHGLAPKKDVLTTAKPSLTTQDKQRLVVLLVLALFGYVLFWTAFEQAGTSMTLFAEESTRLTLPYWQIAVPSTWFMAANPLFAIVLAPIFSWLWLYLGRRQKEPSTVLKFVFGLVLVSLGFVVMICAGWLYDTQGPVSMVWLLAAYFFNTCGEMCISPVGLSAVSKLSPQHLVSLLMGLWLTTMAAANYLGGELAVFYDNMPKYQFFQIPVLIAISGVFLLLLLRKPLTKYSQSGI